MLTGHLKTVANEKDMLFLVMHLIVLPQGIDELQPVFFPGRAAEQRLTGTACADVDVVFQTGEVVGTSHIV